MRLVKLPLEMRQILRYVGKFIAAVLQSAEYLVINVRRPQPLFVKFRLHPLQLFLRNVYLILTIIEHVLGSGPSGFNAPKSVLKLV